MCVYGYVSVFACVCVGGILITHSVLFDQDPQQAGQICSGVKRKLINNIFKKRNLSPLASSKDEELRRLKLCWSFDNGLDASSSSLPASLPPLVQKTLIYEDLLQSLWLPNSSFIHRSLVVLNLYIHVEVVRWLVGDQDGHVIRL